MSRKRNRKDGRRSSRGPEGNPANVQTPMGSGKDRAMRAEAAAFAAEVRSTAIAPWIVPTAAGAMVMAVIAERNPFAVLWLVVMFLAVAAWLAVVTVALHVLMVAVRRLRRDRDAA